MNALPSADLSAIDGWCADDWSELAGARLLITGGTGFLGHWLVAALAHANRQHRLGLRMLLTSRHPETFARRDPALAADPAIELVQADLRTDRVSGEFTHIVHAGTDASAVLNRERPLEMIATVVDGTRHVLAAAQPTTRFLFVSSGAVYGPQPAGLDRVPEEHGGGPDPLQATAAYAEAKRLAECCCAATARSTGMGLVIARLWAFVGPGLPLDAHFAAGNLIADCLARRPLVVQGDGTAIRSYLYAADCAAWLVRLLVRGATGRAYNVGSEDAVSIRDLALVVAACATPSLPVEIRGVPVPGTRVDRYVPSTARARSELGLREWTPLAQAFEKTIAWHRADGIVAPSNTRER